MALVTLIFVGGALSFVYMFQIYQHDFWRPDARRDTPGEAAPVSSGALRAVTVAVAAVIVVLGLWPEPLLAAGQAAAEALREARP